MIFDDLSDAVAAFMGGWYFGEYMVHGKPANGMLEVFRGNSHKERWVPTGGGEKCLKRVNHQSTEKNHC